MPALYAHNKFGKSVIPELPIDIKLVIKKYPRSFRIGLQGPDFLFFYLTRKKINQLGRTLHHNSIYNFMKNALNVIREYGTDSSQYSYILGFICHFALDNACHPYVREYMNSTGCGHMELEGDLDRYILESEDYSPEYFPLYKLVPTDYETALSMAPFYREISTCTIRKSLKWMKSVKKVFFAPNILKRSILDLLFHITFHYKRLNGHVIMPNANKKCKEETKHLYKILKSTKNTAVNLINNFNCAIIDTSLLSSDFYNDFNGNNKFGGTYD